MIQSLFLSVVTLFAADPPPAAPPADGQINPLLGMLPYLAIGFLFIYFMIIRPQKQEQNRRQSLLGAVKKNDRVLTHGGIYGVVTNVHREANEVTIKVDEGTNTKLRMTLGSIAQILGDAPSENTESK